MNRILKKDYTETSEKTLERKLAEGVKALGGLPLKYYNPNATGYPDRVVILPRGRHIWVELKSSGKYPTPLQTHRIGVLRDLGAEVYVIDSMEKLGCLLEYCGSLIKGERVNGLYGLKK